VIHWITAKLADSCVHRTEAPRHAWSTWDARNVGLYRQLHRARQLGIARGRRILTRYTRQRRYTFYCVYATQREGVATRIDDAECPFREFGIILHQALGVESFPRSVYRSVWSSREVRVRERENDSGMSAAADPARGNPCNVHLLAIAPEMILLFLTVRFITNVLDTLEYPRSNLKNQC